MKRMNKGLEIILNSAHDGVIAIDENGLVTLFNKAAERILALNASSVIGRKAIDVIPNTRLPIVLSSGEPELNQHQNVGNTAIITSRVPLKDEAGRIVGAAAVFRDVSEIKALTERVSDLWSARTLLEAVIEATNEAISVADDKGNTIMVNSAYTRITGLPREAVLNKPVTVDIAEGESMHLQILRTGKPVRNARLKVGPAKKEVIVNVAPIFIDGKIRGSVGTIDDISEILALTEELAQARKTDPASQSPLYLGRYHRAQPGTDRSQGPGTAGGRDACHGASARRERDRQGAVRARDPQREQQAEGPVRPGQLRSAFRGAARERIVRLCRRRVHGSGERRKKRAF